MTAHPDFIHLGNLGRWKIKLRKTPADFGDLRLEAGTLVATHVDVPCSPFFVRNPGLLARHYVILSLSAFASTDAHSADSRELASRLLGEEPEFPTFRGHFDFPDWRIDDFVRLAKDCEGSGFYKPFSEEHFRSIEEWLVLSLGEVAFFSIPGFWPESLKTLYSSGALDFMYEGGRMLRTRVNNVTVPVADNPLRPDMTASPASCLQ